jgi:hypothetical protein
MIETLQKAWLIQSSLCFLLVDIQFCNFFVMTEKKIRIYIQFCLLLAVSLILTGCGDTGGLIAPVSGKVTLDGVPMPGVEVVFSPKAKPGNSNSGPYSIGMTDTEGNYELKTRYGDSGAIIGVHTVVFHYPGIDRLDELREEWQDARESDDGGDPEEVKARIAAVKKQLGGLAMIPSTAEQEYEVPAGGNKSCNFKLVSD